MFGVMYPFGEPWWWGVTSTAVGLLVFAALFIIWSLFSDSWE